MLALLHIAVEKTVVLKDFPSGSAMEFFEGTIYLIGDDARQILMLDKDYNILGGINMFAGDEKRIAKKAKADLESSAIIQYKNSSHLLVMGSASREQREKAFLFALPANNQSSFISFDTSEFTGRLTKMGVAEVNIEGASAVHHQLLMSNRGNKTHPDNLLFVTTTNFFEDQQNSLLRILNVVLPEQDFPIGISALSYVAAADTLFFTASIELTSNAYDDGGIGDSYLGCIRNISTQLHTQNLIPDMLVNLSDIDDVFKGQKIESICFEAAKTDHMIAHLVSDNDNGESTLFKVILSWQ